MGCGASFFASKSARVAAAEEEEELPVVELPSAVDRPTTVSWSLHKFAHDRLRKLEELDNKTKVPFILIELTGEGDGEGAIEVCGKNEYGIYLALDEWFQSSWGCEKLDAGDTSEETKIPFCLAQYKWPGYRTAGEQGLNNMGLMTMKLVDFVCGQLSWTLAMVNGGNVGKSGEVREAQVVFKAPHPMNLLAPHLMIELRSAGFVEVSADLGEEDQHLLASLDEYFASRFLAQRLETLDGDLQVEDFCNRYYEAGAGVFQSSTECMDSNMGQLTVEVCDTMAGFPGWSLVACNSGNYGERGENEEQQLVFRKDEHPLCDKAYLLVTLREAGTVEVNGKEVKSAHKKLDRWLIQKWCCHRAEEFQADEYLVRRYTWPSSDMMLATGQIVSFFELHGWEMQVCSQQMIRASEDGEQSREQQLLFRPGASEVGVVEPHLFIELYAGEGDPDLHEQVLANQHIRVESIPPTTDPRAPQVVRDAFGDFEKFIIDYLGGRRDEEAGHNRYHCNVFMCRGKFENNLAQWTMRVCDFLVDALGWSFVVCSLCNLGEFGERRAQQMVFRYDGDKREVPVSRSQQPPDTSEWAEAECPSFWQDEVRSGQTVQRVLPCSRPERAALQVLCDSTFKRVLTRDRTPDGDAPETEEMPYRLEVVQAFRSEHAWLHHRFEERRAGAEPREPFALKTEAAAKDVLAAQHCTSEMPPGSGYLFHGTNPSSAMSILNTGFVLDHAGCSRGSMFGAGIYMAECCSKSDEYGYDDGGNTFPGLRALLVCRCYVGTPLVVQRPGDYIEMAQGSACDCVCGDRESCVGTYRELVFFDERQIYPEYTVIYRRQYETAKVPDGMAVRTSGTTGRFWQTRRDDKRWHNVPVEINKALTRAARAGETQLDVAHGATEFAFSLAERRGVARAADGSTHAVALRAPMQL